MEIFADKSRHLVCTPYSVENLHVMAEQFGIKQCWFHKRIISHYDIPKRRIEEILADPRVNVVSPRKLLKIVYDDIESQVTGKDI